MDPEALLRYADEMYFQRHLPGAVGGLVQTLTGAADRADQFGLHWRLSRAFFFLGQEAQTAAARQQMHTKGITAGGQATARSPEGVEGHFWLGVNLALFAECASGLRAAWALLRAQFHLLKAAEIDETYHEAGPLRVLGRLRHKAPRLLGGSKEISLQCFDRALEIAPTNSVTLIYAAELAADSGDFTRAESFLKRILELPIRADWTYEHRRDQRLASEMLQRLRHHKH